MMLRIALSSLFVFLVCSAAFGQDISAKITGTVTDASGAVISGATVTARDTSRATAYPTHTNAAGVYYLSPLPSGDYTLCVTSSGFSTVQYSAFSLVMNHTAR